jgi:hypothetical protein
MNEMLHEALDRARASSPEKAQYALVAFLELLASLSEAGGATVSAYALVAAIALSLEDDDVG